MTKRNQSRVRMFDVMLAFFTAYAAVISRLPALAAAVDRFKRFLLECKEAMEEERLVSEGITIDKAAQRTETARQVSIIAGGISAFASDGGNHTLAHEMEYTQSDLERMSVDDLLSTCRRIITQASAHITELAAFGITGATLDAATAAIDAFEDKAGTPRQGINIRSDAGERAAELVSQTNAVLRKSIDKLVRQFEASDPEFYSQYWKSRMVVDAATASTDLIVEVTAQGAQPLAAAEIRVEGTGVTGVTDAFGRCVLRGVEPGTRSITVFHRSYAQRTLEGVKLKPGKKTALRADLLPGG